MTLTLLNFVVIPRQTFDFLSGQGVGNPDSGYKTFVNLTSLNKYVKPERFKVAFRARNVFK